jgi:transposase InsO family protein
VNVYPFIEAERAGRRNVKRACALLEVSRAAFSAHWSGLYRREQGDAELAGRIREVHEESRGRHGAPRIHGELARRGRRHGPKRIARLMRSAGIARAVAQDHDPGPGRRGPGGPDPPRLHRRRRPAERPLVRGHHLYRHLGGMAVPSHRIDIASRRVVGYALADHLRTELVSAALANALAVRDPDPGVIFHSDRAVSTPPASSPPSRPAAASRCPWAAPANAETTPFLSRFRLAQRRADRLAGLAHPRHRRAGDRGIPRLVQRHPAAQHARRRDTRRIRRTGQDQEGSP